MSSGAIACRTVAGCLHLYAALAILRERNLRYDSPCVALLMGIKANLAGKRSQEYQRMHFLPPKKNRAQALFFYMCFYRYD
ncbi:hypothetical protein GCM10011513_07520 [Franconibacter daqui]|nr:hypothetical protein GCM10011513_07520 [Franconibacter daqui]